MFLNAVRGFCMALADSVPGVSGGTIAFLLGFYDEFINSLNDMIGKDNAKRKAALVFIIKLGIGWVIGFGASVMVLSSLFQVHIYEISSVFLGLTLFAIPLVVKEEWASIKGKAGCLVFTLIGMALVFCISYFNPTNGNGISVNFEHMTVGLGLYLFFAAMIAITAMVLPGISGSTLLLIFGLYVPVINYLYDPWFNDRFPICHHPGTHNSGCASATYEFFYVPYWIFYPGCCDLSRTGTFKNTP